MCDIITLLTFKYFTEKEKYEKWYEEEPKIFDKEIKDFLLRKENDKISNLRDDEEILRQKLVEKRKIKKKNFREFLKKAIYS